jgi:hypothetical protein
MRLILWYDSSETKGKYLGTLTKPPRYFNKTTAVLFAKYHGSLSRS